MFTLFSLNPNFFTGAPPLDPAKFELSKFGSCCAGFSPLTSLVSESSKIKSGFSFSAVIYKYIIYFYRKIHSNFSFSCLQLILKPQNFPGLRPGPANALCVASRRRCATSRFANRVTCDTFLSKLFELSKFQIRDRSFEPYVDHCMR